jgi:hypothetical protein
MILARRGLMRLASVFATLSVASTPAAEPATIHLRSAQRAAMLASIRSCC